MPKSKKSRALFAYLACQTRPVSKNHIIDLFFPEVRDPRGALRWSISRLRASLGDGVLAVAREHVGVNAQDATLQADLHLLETAVKAQDISALEDLVETADGSFLSDLELRNAPEYEAWRLAQQARCKNLQATMLTTLIHHSIGEQRAVDLALKLVALDVSSEHAWALQVRALQASGQGHEAQRIQRTALEALEREGVLLNGELNAADRPVQPAPGVQVNLSTLQPRVAVLTCEAADEHRAAAQMLTDVLAAAMQTNKTFTTVAAAMVRQIEADSAGVLQAARDAGVDVLLESSFSARKSGYNLTMSLVDVVQGDTLFSWHEQYRQQDMEVIAEQLEAFLGARYEIDLPTALIMRSYNKPRPEWTATEYCLMALPRIISEDGFDPAEAMQLLETALSLKPHHGLASAMLALVRMFVPQFNDDDNELATTLSLARRAVETSQDDAFVLGVSATVIGHIAKDARTGMDLAQRSLSINPYSMMGGIAAAVVAHYRGEDDVSDRYLDDLISYADPGPVTFFCHTCRAMNRYQLKDYAGALDWSERALGHNPKYIVAMRYKAASLGQLGDKERAAEVVAAMTALDPSENLRFFLKRSAYVHTQRLNHLYTGLELAGLPENMIV
ncbi:MAG: hypothetical protein AAF993_09920 [Pseudomonadota bacterium]